MDAEVNQHWQVSDLDLIPVPDLDAAQNIQNTDNNSEVIFKTNLP